MARDLNCWKPTRMSEREFCFWLRGIFDAVRPQDVTDVEMDKIKQTLLLVLEAKPSVSLGGQNGQWQNLAGLQK